ncbi:MAG: hypothetical protein GY899_02490 [Verrucomicrobiaceae bacterium]|nr:hypothetical protein [Verrucomicrobiaceae bacterium]
MKYILSILIASWFFSASLLQADVRINEIAAKANDRSLRWDENEQPFVGSYPPWRNPDFNDSLWLNGDTPIGYDLGNIKTNLGNTLRGISPSLYVRKGFNVPAGMASSSRPLILRINYNDGFIAWVNGIEVARANAGEEKAHLYFDQVAYRGSSIGTATSSFNLGSSSALLSPGENTLAIQIANHNPAGNLRLDMSLTIDESNAPDTILVPLGSTVRYFPGLMEPGSDIHEPAILGNPQLDNQASDWIELYNDSTSAVDLGNWSLSDDESNPQMWIFPEQTMIPAGGYLIILADNPPAAIDSAHYLHANFKLDGGGEFLGLFDDKGEPVSIAGTTKFPKQHDHYSYGLDSTGENYVFHETPTPGRKNSGNTFSGKADAPDFDIKGGFFPSAQTITLTSETPNATIRYTTDGTQPTENNGTLYTQPLRLNPISKKKGHCIRARSFMDGLIPSNTKTNSYLISQDERLLNSPSLLFTADLPRSLYDPFGALAINGGRYVSNQWQPTGLDDYNNVINRGRCYEREIHAEFYFPDGSTGFRSDCGVRAAASAYSRPRMRLSQTGASPWPASSVEKPSFNLYFRNQYGNPEVKLPLNGENAPVSTYQRFRIRAGKNDIKNPFIVDELVRRLSRDMGQPASTGVINSLYINAELKGFYNMVERLRSPWLSSIHGSAPGIEWDTLALQGGDSNVAEGDMIAWDEMITRLNAANSVANWQRVTEYADVVNMADYYLLNIYMATWDWPHNNWVAARERSPEGRYRLYIWDAEGGMNNRGNRPVSQEMINSFIASGGGELRDLWRGLNRWEEFRILFADRINKHLFNGGVLDDRDFESSHIKLLTDQLKDEFGSLLSYMNNETLNTSKIIAWTNSFSGRRSYLFGPNRETFRNNNLWPNLPPPELSHPGGSVPRNYALNMTNESGLIYYTSDGSDPRSPGGSPNPDAISQNGSKLNVELIGAGSEWKYNDADGDLGDPWLGVSYNDSAWNGGPGPLGFGGISDNSTSPSKRIEIATVINPRPRQLTVYFRNTFEIDQAAAYFELDLNIMSDAGAAVYINGIEVFRDSNLPIGALFSTATSNDASDSNEGDYDRYPIDASVLVDGTNVIAVEMHNVSIGSSDMVMDIQLNAIRSNPGNTPFNINEPVTIMARSYQDGEWSALSTADFTVDTIPAGNANLAVVEMLYNPAGANDEEADSGFTDGDQFEFIQLKNIGQQAIDLHGVRFTDGINFDFSSSGVRALSPGEYVIAASDIDAFRFRNGSRHDALIAGQYTGRLNNGGEHVRLIGATGEVIQDFTYETSAPWPDLSDRDGNSIQIIDSSQSHDDGTNWRASSSTGGSPGGGINFTTWQADTFTAAELDDPLVSGPDADLDGDGLSNFAEFALGTPVRNARNGIPMPRVIIKDIAGEAFLFLEFTRSGGERAATFSSQSSRDLVIWTAHQTIHAGETLNPDGSITTLFRYPDPIDSAQGKSAFLRLYISD